VTVTVDANGAVHDARGRFAPLPAVLLRECPPIPVPLVVDVPDERVNFTAVPAPRCPHNSFMRYAVRNCCRA